MDSQILVDHCTKSKFRILSHCYSVVVKCFLVQGQPNILYGKKILCIYILEIFLPYIDNIMYTSFCDQRSVSCHRNREQESLNNILMKPAMPKANDNSIFIYSIYYKHSAYIN